MRENLIVMENRNVTRGHGLLEGWLSQKRSELANRLIPPALRMGRILDIGCGSYPHFLAGTDFREKFSIDQIAMPAETAHRLNIRHEVRNLRQDPRLPFDDGTTSAVTLLAVIEHVPLATAQEILREVHRVLTPGGCVVVTTPAAWADTLLRLLAKLRMVSAEEINEHVSTYRPTTLRASLRDAGFPDQQIRCGTFELGLNLWAVAEKRT